MSGWSSSHFLQSLGWAILNSFWQIALLWLIFLAINHFFRPRASVKYKLSVNGIVLGFAWFLATFFYYLQSGSIASLAFFNTGIQESSNLLQITLLSAAVAYLALLVFPSYKLYRNWKFVRTIRNQGLEKAGLHYRLFVQKIAGQLGITKKVMVYASELVKSPLTIGYVKPVILVPVAALNNLSTQQVEAILLHELSHIRRFDYLVNFMISIINTILYFNPFVRQFMKTIEEERENCCDELVLQYGYDNIGYAAALLTLEKLSARHQVLTLAATGKNYLLTRIEKIVGLEKKKGFKLNHFAGLLAAFLCIFAFNSVLIIREQQQTTHTLAYDNLGNAFNFFDSRSAAKQERATAIASATEEQPADLAVAAAAPQQSSLAIDFVTMMPFAVDDVAARAENMFTFVAQDDIDASLSVEEKEKVSKTVAATKNIITTLQWKEMETAIGDALTQQEKQLAHAEFMKAFDQQQEMKRLEQKLKAQYDSLNWNHITAQVSKALVDIKLDSLEQIYVTALVQLERTSAEVNSPNSHYTLPDESMTEIRRATAELKQQVQNIRQIRHQKKAVKL